MLRERELKGDTNGYTHTSHRYCFTHCHSTRWMYLEAADGISLSSITTASIARRIFYYSSPHDRSRLDPHFICRAAHLLIRIAGALDGLSCSKKDQNSFDQQFGVLQDEFLLDHHLLSWQIESDQKSKANALVDDLRVVAALQKADRLWKNAAYQTTAKEIAQALKDKNMYRGILSDYYDASTNRTSHTITLSYLDPKAIKELESLKIFTKQMTSNQLAILKQAPRKKDSFLNPMT